MRIFRFIRKGIAHQQQNTECQDSAEYYVFSEDDAVMAVSDGASRAKYGKLASQSNVEAVKEVFEQIPLNEFVQMSKEEQKQKILGQCVGKIIEMAKKENCPSAGQFSATLVFVVVNKDYILTGHIGDGAIYILDENRKVRYSSDPENGASSTRTYFTVSEDVFEHFRIDVIERKNLDAKMIVLMSDGPYLMFKNRGFGNPIETAEEMAPFILDEQVESDKELGYLLDDMTEIESEKTDDWSMLVGAFDLPPCKVVSEEEEEETEAENTTDEKVPEEKEDKNVIYIPEKLCKRTSIISEQVKITNYLLQRINKNFKILSGKKRNDCLYEYHLVSNRNGYLLKSFIIDGNEEQKKHEVNRMRKIFQMMENVKECSYIDSIVTFREVRLEETDEVVMFYMFQKEIVSSFMVREDKIITLSEFVRQCMNRRRVDKESIAIHLAKEVLKAMIEFEKYGLIHGHLFYDTIWVDRSSRRVQFLVAKVEYAEEKNIKNQYDDIIMLGKLMMDLIVKLSAHTSVIDQRLAEIIRKASGSNIAERYMSASEMLKDIEQL